jgi:hypothetical protein
MKKLNLLLGAFAVSIMAGCTSIAAKETPIVPDMAHANFGPYPTDYEGLIKTWAELKLKDPESARYVQFSKPRKEWAVADSQPIYGWSVCATINAKNSYGGYSGAQVYWFFFRDGKIFRGRNIEEDAGIPGVISIPGNRISVGHDVNCDDGDAQ